MKWTALICYQNNESADADIDIDDVAEDAIGNMLEDVCTEHRADNDTAQAIKIVDGDRRGEETVVGSYASHHHIANQKIGLRHCHVMLFRRLTLNEVKHGGRTLHAEEATHQSAECPCADLHFLGRWQFYTSTKQHKVDADQNERHAKDAAQNMVFDTCQSENGNGRDDNKRQQNRQKSLPSYIVPQPPYDSCRSCDGQQS